MCVHVCVCVCVCVRDENPSRCGCERGCGASSSKSEFYVVHTHLVHLGPFGTYRRIHDKTRRNDETYVPQDIPHMPEVEERDLVHERHGRPREGRCVVPDKGVSDDRISP